MNDIYILLIFLCFLFILMPRKNKKRTPKKKRKRSKKKSKIKENIQNQQLNVYNKPLQVCSTDPMTGWKRDGKCSTHDDDAGTHTVCARVDDEFLDYTKSKGNDLSTESGSFPGLKDGDNWCLCALRWQEALHAGKAPPLNLNSTNKKTLEYINLPVLENHKV